MDFGPLVSANNPNLRELQPSQGLDLSRLGGPRLYPELPAHESTLGESFRVLIKRRWVVIICLVTIFSLVAIASLKMTSVCEAGGTIQINKPDATLDFQNTGFL